ncbi:Cytochrome P450 [Corchorus olitorius]|uniref:Cytochrome P450 n=1 Tax=Corchorus olitorius TaxID=93759 RepID=A0A1R3I623_9ROSI|nr:Cytochrome P450 [Corchorus olitorius]
MISSRVFDTCFPFNHKRKQIKFLQASSWSRRLPILGNLLDVGDKPHESMAKLALTHGPIMTLKLGSLISIVISSENMAKQVLQKHDLAFSNRPIRDCVRAFQHHELGLPWLPVCPLWRTLRKVCNSHIFTTQKLDANQFLRRNKIQEFVANVQKCCHTGEAINIGQAAFNTTINLLSNTICSMDLVDPNSPTAQEFKETVSGILEEAAKPNLADYFPMLRIIDPQGIRRRISLHFKKLLDLFGNMSSCKLPPGPRRLPILGNLLDVGDKPHESMAKLALTHGPIMTLKLGSLISIVISSENMAKQVLQKHDLAFSNRPIPDAVRASHHHELGLPWLPVCPLWRTLRKVCNSHLFTSQKLDANQFLRRNKIQQLIAHVQKCCRTGEAINIGQAAFNTTINLLSNTIFSMALVDPNSPTAQEFKETVSGIMEEAGKPNLADYFPMLRMIDPQGIRRRISIHFDKLLDLFGKMYDERLESRKAQKGGISPMDLDMEEKFGISLQMANPLRAIPIPV